MYRTLTLGFGQMTPQTWMVPRQKYDVIHYIREAYLKPHNPGQFTRVDQAYLSRLPKGKSRGPEPVEIQPWVTMDYGPSLFATLRDQRGRPLQHRLQGDRGPARRWPGGRVARPGLGGLRSGHDAVRRRLDGPGLHRLERHQLQRFAPGPSPAGGQDGAGEPERAAAGPTPGPASFDATCAIRGATDVLYGPLPRRWFITRGCTGTATG